MGSIYSIIEGFNLAAYQASQMLASQLTYHIMSYVVESYIVVLPLIVLYLIYKRDRNVFVFVVAGLVLYIIGDIIKTVVREPRPCSLQGAEYIQNYCDTGYSFPSNHATVLTGLALFINYRYLRILYILWVILLLFGKLFLAQHYLTDLIAGVIISLIVARLLQVYSKRINESLAGIFNRVLGRVYKI